MEIKDLLKQNRGFSPLELPEIAEKAPLDFRFDELGKEKIESLEQSISEIKTSIEERKLLSKKTFEECEKIKTEINNFLLENQASDFEENKDIIKEKNDLRSRKIAISELQLNEKIDCWKDVANLQRELRNYEKELIEKQSRINSLNKILEQTN